MLDDKGLKIPTYTDLLTEMESKSKELFGENINLSSYTPLGILLRIFSWFLAIVWQVVENVYHSSFIKDSEGIQLDRHGRNRTITRNPASESTVFLTITGAPYYTIPIGSYFETEDEIRFMTIYELTLDQAGKGTIEAVSVERGAENNVLANTIIVISEPVEELYTVTNEREAAGGSNQESDVSYRERLIQGNIAQNNAILDAIYSRVRNVSGVMSVKIKNNNTMDIVDGVPPKSLNVIVVGGNDAEVGQAIYSSIAAGVGTSGEITYTATAADGNTHEIHFSKAISTLVYFKVSVTVTEEFPADGVDMIKDNIISYVGGNSSDGTNYTGLDLSEEMIYTRLFHNVYSIPGVENTTELLAGFSKEDLTAGNISPGLNSVLTTSDAAIEVNVTYA
ncbi:baseplate J/gp47 family protein [Desemzia sp. C1]|uniref:baseplate J/gp47 family protein n=1 Tax=Desemzia sp. C1 TaxID=2892016 RepID=UPI001E31CBA2|nr:baseplate J/gp47 family protein [Desemzia sp. C1]MCI3027679.1 baseplate J/gp47 family protein [Desemzia sp. C1]